jgi:hypothetical protein
MTRSSSRLMAVLSAMALAIALFSVAPARGQLASDPAMKADVVLQQGHLSETLKRANTCEKQLAAALKALKECEAASKEKDGLIETMTEEQKTHIQDLNDILAVCMPGMTYEKWKRCKDCGPLKPTGKRTAGKAVTAARVDECVLPAVKVGNRCDCSGEAPLKFDGKEYKAVPVKLQGSKPWFRSVSCSYTSEAVRGYLEYLSRAVGEVCDLGAGQEDESLVLKCEQTKLARAKLMQWADDLQSDRNNVRPLDRDAWETIWNEVQKLKARYGDLFEAVCILCGCREGESPQEACLRKDQETEARFVSIEDKNLEQDGRLDNHEQRLVKVEDEVEEHDQLIDDLSDNQWTLGVGAFHIVRFGEEMPRSTGLLGLVGYRSWFAPHSGMLAEANFGYADTNNAENHTLLGGRALYLHALGDDRSSALAIGMRGAAEVVDRGTNVADLQGLLGAQFCTEMVCVEPYVAFGGSRVVRRYEALERRNGRMIWTSSAAFGLNFYILLGGSDDDGAESRETESSVSERSERHERHERRRESLTREERVE